jgi:NADH-quinone oxidoreductase subunit H
MIAWLTLTAYNTLYERRMCALMQGRYGPNRAGPQGLLQPIADAVKLLVKEDLMPVNVSRGLFVLAPILAILTAIIMFAVVPFTRDFAIAGYPVTGRIADVNVGVLYVFAVSSMSVYGILLGGWSSNNKYSHLGAMRTGASMISYELAMGLGIIVVAMMAQSLSLVDIVKNQELLWNAFKFPHGTIAFVLFFIAILAETNRAPFDLPEAEQELTGGYLTEYSSMKFGGFFVAEYGNMITASAMIATFFFGGWTPLPFGFVDWAPPLVVTILGPLALVAKIAFFCFVIIWVRWTIPRYRYDQLMNIGWKVLLPTGLGNIALAAACIAFYDRIF